MKRGGCSAAPTSTEPSHSRTANGRCLGGPNRSRRMARLIGAARPARSVDRRVRCCRSSGPRSTDRAGGSPVRSTALSATPRPCRCAIVTLRTSRASVGTTRGVTLPGPGPRSGAGRERLPPDDARTRPGSFHLRSDPPSVSTGGDRHKGGAKKARPPRQGASPYVTNRRITRTVPGRSPSATTRPTSAAAVLSQDSPANCVSGRVRPGVGAGPAPDRRGALSVNLPDSELDPGHVRLLLVEACPSAG